VEVVGQGKNGVEAVNMVRELNPHLVFLDVQMPGIDGFGVIKRLLEKKAHLEKGNSKVRRMIENSDTTRQKLDRLVQMVEQRPIPQKGKLVVKSGNRLFLVDSDEIIYAS